MSDFWRDLECRRTDMQLKDKLFSYNVTRKKRKALNLFPSPHSLISGTLKGSQTLLKLIGIKLNTAWHDSIKWPTGLFFPIQTPHSLPSSLPAHWSFRHRPSQVMINVSPLFLSEVSSACNWTENVLLEWGQIVIDPLVTMKFCCTPHIQYTSINKHGK